MGGAPRAKPRDARVAVVGAGPAGLATAWFLRRAGFRHVTVFEERGRVGGLCNTLTEDYKSFDLGANYIAPNYRETLRLAREVGARRYPARPWIAVRVPPDQPAGEGPAQQPLQYISMLKVVRELRDEDGRPVEEIGLLELGWGIARYLWKRLWLRRAIDQPTFERIHERPDLCISFRDWLEQEGLWRLRSLFEIPITLMGYGYLHEIAAPYALRFLSVGLFVPMVLRQVPGVGAWFRWPKRFEFGFQRMWEALSWRLNVRCNVKVRRIVRSREEDPHPIRIEFEHPQRIFRRDEQDVDTLWFDYLIIACSRTGSLGHRHTGAKADVQFDITKEEHVQFEVVETHRFCVTTLHPKPDARPRPPRPVVCAIPFTPKTMDRPWALVQLWGEDSDMLQCYTRLPTTEEGVEGPTSIEVSHCKKVLPGVIRLIRLLGGDVYPIEGIGGGAPGDAKKQRWESYMEWPYFGHVTPEAMAGGWFQRMEALQGNLRTYWVGGATDFESVELIVRYAKQLVERHFEGKRA
jgi:hypothetical protein